MGRAVPESDAPFMKWDAPVLKWDAPFLKWDAPMLRGKTVFVTRGGGRHYWCQFCLTSGANFV